MMKFDYCCQFLQGILLLLLLLLVVVVHCAEVEVKIGIGMENCEDGFGLRIDIDIKEEEEGEAGLVEREKQFVFAKEIRKPGAMFCHSSGLFQQRVFLIFI